MQSQFLTYLLIIVVLTLLTVVIRNIIHHNKDQEEYRKQTRKRELDILSKKLQAEHDANMLREFERRDRARLHLRRTNRDNTPNTPNTLPIVWSSAALYQKGDIVSYLNNRYIAEIDNINTNPNANPLVWGFPLL